MVATIKVPTLVLIVHTLLRTVGTVAGYTSVQAVISLRFYKLSFTLFSSLPLTFVIYLFRIQNIILEK